jgi:2-hydroxychromene-2-carboxylate isomerase
MTAQRVAEAGGAGDVDRLSHAILEALWRDDLDIADESVIGALCERAGFDPATSISGARTPRTTLELERNNREAIVRGVMGSPTYFVDGENLHGQDRLDFVEWALQRGAPIGAGER